MTHCTFGAATAVETILFPDYVLLASTTDVTTLVGGLRVAPETVMEVRLLRWEFGYMPV